MSDYAVEFKVRNGRIKRAIREAGYKTVSAMCRANGLSPQSIGALLNLKVSPMLQTGTWRQSVYDLADALSMTPEDLFAASQRTLALRGNTTERYMTENDVHRLVADGAQQAWKLLDYGDPAATIGEDESVASLLRKADVLDDRERTVLSLRFDEDLTLEEIGQRLDLSSARVRQIIATVLRKLRRPSRIDALSKVSPLIGDLFAKWDAEHKGAAEDDDDTHEPPTAPLQFQFGRQPLKDLSRKRWWITPQVRPHRFAWQHKVGSAIALCFADSLNCDMRAKVRASIRALGPPPKHPPERIR